MGGRADPGEREDAPASQAGGGDGLRRDPRPQHGLLPALRLAGERLARLPVSDHDDRADLRPLRVEWSPQGTGGKRKSVADPRGGVDHRQGQVLGEGGVLQPVVHHQGAGAGLDGEPRPRGAVPGHDRRRGAGEEKGLVADLRGAVPLRVDPERAGERAAVAAGEKGGPFTHGGEKRGDRQGRRRLARPAHGEVADANHRQRRPFALPAHPPAGNGAVERGRGPSSVGRSPRDRQKAGSRIRPAPP